MPAVKTGCDVGGWAVVGWPLSEMERWTLYTLGLIPKTPSEGQGGVVDKTAAGEGGDPRSNSHSAMSHIGWPWTFLTVTCLIGLL